MESLHLASSFEPLVKFVNQKKLAMSVGIEKRQKKDNKMGLDEKDTSTQSAAQKRNEQ